jgi:hypothetical protein
LLPPLRTCRRSKHHREGDDEANNDPFSHNTPSSLVKGRNYTYLLPLKGCKASVKAV